MTATSRAPAISVFMPVYNVAAYIDEAISSIRYQTFTDFELLIIDDGSTDESVAIARRHAADDPRLQVLVNETNRGRPATRNRGLDAVRGQYIALMDADDRAVPTRFSQQKRYLETHRDIDVLASRWVPMNADGVVQSANPRQRQQFSSDEIAARMLFHCPIHQPTIMARAKALTSYRYDLDFSVAQDHELWARMAGRHRFAVIDAELLHYRQHATQAIAATDRIIEARRRIFARELAALGIAYESGELDLHYHLFHFKGRRLFESQAGRAMDAAFIGWAKGWMEGLVAANARVKRYPEPAFSHYISARWLHLCRKAAGVHVSRAAALRIFLGSSLARPVPKAALFGKLDPY